MLPEIIIVPALVAFFFALTRSLQWAFISIYIPVFFFFPDYFVWHIPGIPDPNFDQAVVVFLMIVFLIKLLPGWKFSVLDILVILYAFLMSYSEYSNVGYFEAQNLIFQEGISIICPYILAKSLIEPYGLRTEFAKSIVLMLFIIACFLIFEMFFRQGLTLWQQFIGPFFGDVGWSRLPRGRWGLTRAQGPCVHPIVAGTVMVIGLNLQIWLIWSRGWIARYGEKGKMIGLFILFVLFGGTIATLSRAPWIGSLLIIFVVLLLGFVTQFSPKVSTRYGVMGGILVGVVMAFLFVIKPLFVEYASVERIEAGSQEHETVSYRYQLLDTYQDSILEKWRWGWGRYNKEPINPIQPSIDNYYIWMALRHGIFVVSCLIIIISYITIRLFTHSMTQPVHDPPYSAFCFFLLGIILHIVWITTTVTLQGKGFPVLFMVIGWAEGYLQTRGNRIEKHSAQPMNTTKKAAPSFRRVLT